MKKLFPNFNNSEYWEKVRKIAELLKSDGCTGVPDFYLICCLEHDIHYRTGTTIFGKKITRAEADARFRYCMQKRSPFGVFSPMAWWRWIGVRILGKKLWKGED